MFTNFSVFTLLASTMILKMINSCKYLINDMHIPAFYCCCCLYVKLGNLAIEMVLQGNKLNIACIACTRVPLWHDSEIQIAHSGLASVSHTKSTRRHNLLISQQNNIYFIQIKNKGRYPGRGLIFSGNLSQHFNRSEHACER